MKRNLDTILDILKLTEDQKPGEYVDDLTSLELKYSHDQVIEHIDLAIKGDLLEGRVLRSLGGGPNHAQILRLTNAGHDFLAQARSHNVWETVKRETSKAGLEMTLAFAKAAVGAAYKTAEVHVLSAIAKG